MKITVFIAAVIFAFSGSALAGDYVKGHWRDTNRDGVKDTYVDGYYRSKRDSSTYNNYSTSGNTNPYTGKPGTIDPSPNIYQPSYPQYTNPYNSFYK